MRFDLSKENFHEWIDLKSDESLIDTCDIVFVDGSIAYMEQFISNIQIYISLGCCYMKWIDGLFYSLTTIQL